MTLPAPYRAAAALERFLGDPRNPESHLSFRQSLALDEAEAYPHEPLNLLGSWGLPRYHIPAPLGGDLMAIEQLLSIARTLARRDLTLAIASGVCFVGSVPVWVAGSPTQQRRLADLLLAPAKVGFAVTERAHGHDLIANETVARRTDNGYLLSGEKWSWGNATLGAAFTLHARTADQAGPRSHSMFLVEKARLDPGHFQHLPKIRTMGLRAHDLSGIRFEECLLPADSLLGSEGAGLEIATKTVQLTRTLCAGLALGAADTATRAVLDFVQERILYGKTVLEIPHAQATLAEAFVDLLICDCVATSAARAWQITTDEMSVWSAVAKYLAPVMLETTVRNLAAILGGRFFMREEHWDGIFQKIYRDLPIISIFEGNSLSQLHGLGIQLRQLLRSRPLAGEDEGTTNLASIFDVTAPLPTFLDTERIELHSHGMNTALQGIGLALEHLRTLDDSPATLAEIIELTELLLCRHAALADQVASARFSSDKAPEVLELARRYAELHAAACCIHLWVQSRRHSTSFFAQGEWLVLALMKLLRGQMPSRGFCPPTYVANTTHELIRLARENRLFAVVPLPLGGLSNHDESSEEWR